MSKGAAGGDLEPPAGIKGFGNCLLWMLATRAPEIVDSVYQSGRAKPGQDSRMIDGQHLPTRAVVAQLVLAGELGTPRLTCRAVTRRWTGGRRPSGRP